MEQNSVRQPMSRRIVTQMLAIMLAMAAIIGSLSHWALRSTYIRMYTSKAEELVRMVAFSVDGDPLEEYVRTGVTDEYYAHLLELLNQAKENFKGVQYLFLLYPMEDHFIYIAEGIAQADDPSLINVLGDTFFYEDLDQYYHAVMDTRQPLEEAVYGADQGYGSYLMTLAPVLDSEGNLAAIVEADCILQDLNAVINPYLYRILCAQLLLIFVVIAVILLAFRRDVTTPLARLTQFVTSYEHGRVEGELLQFPYEDEIRYLAGSFQKMTVRIDQYIQNLTAITAEKERISTELNVATQIQADMLPRIFPAFPDQKEFDLFAVMDPAKEVGGDFYDYFLIDEDHLALVMADVSGKGVPAALFMVIAKTLLKNRAQSGGTPGEILADVNMQLCEGNDAELFVTTYLGILTISTGHLVSASAGHEYPAVYRKGEGFRLFKDKHGLPLAAMEGARYRESELDLHHGDALFLYTDGVMEATDAALTLFGEQRTIDALNAHATETPEQIIGGVLSAINAFVGDAPQFDDTTMLCLRFF